MDEISLNLRISAGLRPRGCLLLEIAYCNQSKAAKFTL